MRWVEQGLHRCAQKVWSENLKTRDILELKKKQEPLDCDVVSNDNIQLI
jgi:hypothetical protein